MTKSHTISTCKKCHDTGLLGRHYCQCEAGLNLQVTESTIEPFVDESEYDGV